MKNKALLIIDPQNDFMDTVPVAGSLAVNGAQEDMRRLSEYIRQSINEIDAIVITLDTHAPYDIGHATYWQNSEKNAPSPFTVIEAQDLISGKYTTTDPKKATWALKYAKELERQGKYKITVWPTHCVENTYGHGVEKTLQEAVLEWEEVRGLKAQYVKKGMNPDTENYSVFKAEVPIDNDPKTHLNQALIDSLAEYKTIEVAGEALSHCVASSVQDLVNALPSNKVQSIVLLTDCMSSVLGFETNGAAFLNDMASRGVGAKAVKKELNFTSSKTRKIN